MDVSLIFVVLMTVHFVADWVFQSHDTAMRKSSESRVRWVHCLVYSCFMWTAMALCGFWGLRLTAAYWVLLLSHYVEDTYKPVYLWAYYVRRVPGIRLWPRGSPESVEAFRAWFGTPLGCILGIAVDQIVHVVCLWLAIACLYIP